MERAHDSNQWVVHTQEMLTAIETVLSTAVDAESAVRSYLTSEARLAARQRDREGGTRVSRRLTADA